MSTKKTLQDKQSPIVIVGAGVFGLSSAIHLSEAGFTNITVFDRQPYHETHYDFDRCCDAASADCNKIIRAAYGHEVWYQNLTLEAIKLWESWNESLAKSSSSSNSISSAIPPGMASTDRIYVNCGNYHFGDGQENEHGLNAFEKQSVDHLTAAGLGHTQYLFDSNPKEADRAIADGFGYAIDPFNLSKTTTNQDEQNENQNKSGQYHGYLDMIGGFVYADKACRYALHRAQQLGVRFILDKQAGNFEQFLEENKDQEEKEKTVTGIKTSDGKSHPAALTIVACGGWTPGLILPEMDGLCETTAGSVAMIHIPEGSPLRRRFSPDNFPVFQWNVHGGESGNLYGFPLTDHGVLKIGYRGTKYTYPQVFDDSDDAGNHDKGGSSSTTTKVRSVPITQWTTPSITGLPQKSTEVIQKFLDTYIPELREAGIRDFQTRLCWYTDSFDNQWVIDHVPNRSGVIVATGGSGHAFKFLPLLGRFVVERVTGMEESGMLHRFQWRSLKEGEKPYNKLMAGFDDVNALQKVKMV